MKKKWREEGQGINGGGVALLNQFDYGLNSEGVSKNSLAHRQLTQRYKMIEDIPGGSIPVTNHTSFKIQCANYQFYKLIKL